MYTTILYLQFAAVAYFLSGRIDVLLAGGLALAITNARFVRIMDEESVYMLMLTLMTAVVMMRHEPRLLASYWVGASPLPFIFAGSTPKRDFDVVPLCRPFSIQLLLDGMNRFLRLVPEGRRVLMCIEDPEGEYARLFGDNRWLIELPCHAASLRSIHLLPDWWAVAETNHVGAPEFWGRDPATVGRRASQWRADFLIVYGVGVEAAKEPEEWMRAGYRVLAEFDWRRYAAVLEGEVLDESRLPTWWLLQASAPAA